MRCQQRVFADYHLHQCTRKGVVGEEGKVWCKQHLPSAVKARREESNRQWAEKHDSERLLRTTRDALIEAVLDEVGGDLSLTIFKARKAYEAARAS